MAQKIKKTLNYLINDDYNQLDQVFCINCFNPNLSQNNQLNLEKLRKKIKIIW